MAATPNKGGTAAPKPPAPARPAATSPQPKRVDPFLNPQNLQDLAGFNFNQAGQSATLDKGLADQRANTTYQLQQLAKTFRESTASTADAMAARGLYHSSIKDAALFDLEATKSLQQQFLNDQLHSAQSYADAQKLALSNYATDFLKGLNASSVENARQINDTIQPAPPPPQPAPGQTLTPGSMYLPNDGVSKAQFVNPDGTVRPATTADKGGTASPKPAAAPAPKPPSATVSKGGTAK